MSVFVLPLHNSSSPSTKADTYMPAQTAAEYSGYNLQYIRRLLVSGAIGGVKVSQVWLVKVSTTRRNMDGAFDVDRCLRRAFLKY